MLKITDKSRAAENYSIGKESDQSYWIGFSSIYVRDEFETLNAISQL